ncbi:MAG: hypothetical protein WB783_05615 [Arenicellales bacterium]
MSYRRAEPAYSAAAAAVVLAMFMLNGCANMKTVAHDPLEDQISYMKRAAMADPQVRTQMKAAADRHADQDPFDSKLRIGFLLSSPNEDPEDTVAGEQILRDILEHRKGLDPRLRDLIEVRLQEAEARQALRQQLDEVNSKIDKLLSIESSTGQKKSGSGARRTE